MSPSSERPFRCQTVSEGNRNLMSMSFRSKDGPPAWMIGEVRGGIEQPLLNMYFKALLLKDLRKNGNRPTNKLGRVSVYNERTSHDARREILCTEFSKNNPAKFRERLENLSDIGRRAASLSGSPPRQQIMAPNSNRLDFLHNSIHDSPTCPHSIFRKFRGTDS